MMNERDGLMVVDVGGGHTSPFAKRRTQPNTFVLGMDILFEQVANNPDANAGLVCNVCTSIPLKDATADLIVSRSVLEHLPDNAAFVAECHRTLKPGGRAIHVCPTRRAPFALINRIIPNSLTKKLIKTFFPQWADECGFPTFYDHCSYPELPRLHERNGLMIEELHLRYYQSIYFKPFLPIYLISVLYDLTLWALRIRFLCSQIVIVARRP
jgi:SAM-dependent methyltransferase